MRVGGRARIELPQQIASDDQPFPGNVGWKFESRQKSIGLGDVSELRRFVGSAQESAVLPGADLTRSQ
jgi:hypothetical protein